MKNIIVTLLFLVSFNVIANDLGYKKNANPNNQVTDAAATAKKEGKLILLIAGGEWCRWCHVLDKYLSKNESINKKLKETFVVTKIYLGEENMNVKFFSKLPQANGYPYFWIMSPDQEVVGTQDTGSLEKGRYGYDNNKFKKFIGDWADKIK